MTQQINAPALTPVSQSLTAFFRDSPFGVPGEYHEVQVPAGLSIQEILDRLASPEKQPYLHVILNDEIVPPDQWALTVPHQDDVLNIMLVPRSGDAGNILKAIAVIAVVVAVTWALGPAGLALESAALIGGIAGVAGLATSLALNALFPPPVAALTPLTATSSGEDPVYGFSASSNQLKPYACIPRLYGRRRFKPDMAIKPYIISAGSDQYLYQMFCLGYGPLKIEDIYIGETPIGAYRDVELVIHESFVAGDALKICKEDYWQDGYSIKLLKNSEQIIYTTASAEKAALAIQFPSGLYAQDGNNGNRLALQVILDVQIKQSGTTTWRPLTDFQATVIDGALNATVTQDSWNAIGATYTGDPQHVMVNELPASSSVPDGEYKTLATMVSNEDGSVSYSYQDYQNSYSVSTSTSQVKVERSSSRPFFVNVHVVFPVTGQWEFKVNRLTDDYSQGERYGNNYHFADAYISSLSSIKAEPPVAPNKAMALIELKIKATDQLNGVVNDLILTATSMLPVYKNGTWVVEATRNPAWCTLSALRGPETQRVTPDKKIVLADYIDWANWCDAAMPSDATQKRACCDLLVSSATSQWDLITTLAATGYAAPTRAGFKHTIAVDRPVSTPVQLFTSRNSRGFEGVIHYHEQPHAIRVQYTPTDSLDQDEIVVYDDGYSADGAGGTKAATLFENMELVGIGRYAQAWVMGRRSLAQGRLRIEEFTVTVDIERMLCRRGSFVRLAHNLPMVGSFQSRIIRKDGNTVTVESPVTLTGPVYCLVRTQRNAQLYFSVSSYADDMLVLAGDAGELSVGDLIVYGNLQRVYLDCFVKAIKKATRSHAKLSLTHYAPAIYTCDTDPIPPYDMYGGTGESGTGGGDNANTPGLVTSLLGAYQITYDQRTPRITVDLSWGLPVAGGTAVKYKVWFADTAGWRLLGETTKLTYKAFNEYIFTDADGNLIDLNGRDLVFAVAGVGTDGSSLNPDYAKHVTVTPEIQAPNEIAALYATPHYMAIEVSWVYTDDPFRTASVEVWGSIINDRATARLIAKVDADVTSYVHSGLDPDLTWYYWAVAADGNGNYSAWHPATNASSVSAVPLTAKTQYIDISGFTGFNVNAGGAFTPPNATLTAIVNGVTNPTYSWAVTGATTGDTDQPAVIITPDDSDTKIHVTLTVNGDNVVDALTKSITMPITRSGAPGEAGADGIMSAFPTIYRWTANATPPARPTIKTAYTWGSPNQPAPAGWYSYAPSNTTPGAYLWSITVPVTESASTATSELDWTNEAYPIRAIAYNGADGTDGAAGNNGSATFVITRAGNDSSAPTALEVAANIGRSPVAGDLVTISYNSYNNAVVYRYTTVWSLFVSYITGSLIVQRTLTANHLATKTITAASGVLGDAAVNTLQIAGNAVTVPTYFESNTEVSGIGNTATTIISGAISTTGTQPIVVSITSGIGGGASPSALNTVATDSTVFVYIETAGGAVQAYKTVNQGVSVSPAWMEAIAGSCMFTASEVPAGTWYVRVKARCNQTIDGSSVRGHFARYPRMTVMETKR